jgi:hypothetical protein
MHPHFVLPCVTCDELFALRICIPHPHTNNCKYIPNVHRLQVNLAAFSSVGTSVQCRQGNKVFFKCTYKQTYCTYVLAQLICMAARANVVGASGCIAGCALPHCMATRTLRNCGWVCCASAHSHIAWQRALWATMVGIVECLRAPTCTGNARQGAICSRHMCWHEGFMCACMHHTCISLPWPLTHHTRTQTHTHMQSKSIVWWQ